MIWLALVAVVGSVANTPPPLAVPPGQANPASAACIADGGRIELVDDAVGNTNGICHRKDGRACEQWALYNSGQCALPPPAIPN